MGSRRRRSGGLSSRRDRRADRPRAHDRRQGLSARATCASGSRSSCTTSSPRFGNGLLISLIFYVKLREARAAAALHKAEAERHLLSKQAIEAELKLMQAQVEPHFLFNTLASVQYLTETDPPQANVLLGHLIAYLRAALPQLRASSSTLGREDRARRGLSQHPADADRAAAGVRDRRAGRAARSSVPAEAADFARRERDQAWRRAVGGRRHGHDRRARRPATASSSR